MIFSEDLLKIQKEHSIEGKIKEVKFPTIKMIFASLDGFSYKCDNGLIVIQSLERANGKEWLHTSFSRKNRIPDYRDIQFVKKVFIGEDKKAIMIFPEKSKHVNFMKNCLHLFSGEDGLPDFTYGTGMI